MSTFTDILAIAIFAVASLIRLVPVRLGVRRVHLMGVLLGPLVLTPGDREPEPSWSPGSCWLVMRIGPWAVPALVLAGAIGFLVVLTTDSTALWLGWAIATVTGSGLALLRENWGRAPPAVSK